MNEKVAIETARELAEDNQDDIWEVDGYTFKVKAIPVAIISDVTNRIPEPEIPVWHNEEYNRDELNPNDPEYTKAKNKVDQERGQAMIDATVMFGIELPDGVPPTDKWLPKLKFLEKRGQIDLSPYDLNDPLELDFVFKRYVLANVGLINYIQNLSTVTPEDVSKAGRPFRRPTKR